MTPSSSQRGSGSEAYLDEVEEILAAGIEEFAGDWVRTEAELVERHPRYARAISRRVAALQAEGWLLQQPGPNEGFPERLGDFRLLQRLGTGGMGVVFLAEQEALGRQVALKILPRQATLDPRFLERFQREAHAAAQLQHPNIVPLYGVGKSEGVHWYAMQYVDGIALDELLVQARRWWLHVEEQDSPSKAPTTAAQAVAALLRAGESGGSSDGGPALPQVPAEFDIAREAQADPTILTKYHRCAARIALRVSEALAFAHGQGILHRDIKPSNLLLDGRGRVWVADFGLCKTADSRDLTLTGDLVGTLRYMAPEQLSGQSDVRSEVYSLGATLYELLTLRPAFDHPSRHGLMQQIAEREPTAPTQVDPRIPHDLEAIVLKAMRKDPAQRYPTADAMAQDLAAYLEGRPITARAPSAFYYLRLAVRRNKGLAATVAGAVIALLALTAVYIGHLQAARHSAEDARDDARWRAYLASIGGAESAIQLGDVVVARQRLEEAPAEHRGWEWRHYQSRLDQSVATVEVPVSGCIAYSADGAHLFTGGDDTVIRQFDAKTGEKVRELTGHRGFLHDLDISMDGRLLATAGSVDNTAGIWDLETGKANWLRHPHEAKAVAFHPTEPLLATGCDDAVVRVWSVDAAVEVGRFAGHRSGVHAIAFSGDGLRLATGSVDRTARIWDVLTRECLHVLPHDGVVKDVAFDDSGLRLLTSSADGTAHVWDVGSGRATLHLRGHRGGVTSAAWSPSDARIATASADGTVRTWDAATGTKLAVLHGHGDLIHDVAFSPDATTLASVGRDGTLRRWDAASPPSVTTIRAHLSQTEALAVSPDGLVMATGGRYGVARLWSTQTGLESGAILSHPSSINALAFDPTGRRLAVGGEDTGEIKIWNAQTLQLERTLQSGFGSVMGIVFSSHGHLLVAGESGVARFDLETDRLLQAVELGFCFSIALHPKRDVAAVGTNAGSTVFWDLTTGRTESLQGHAGRVTTIAFLPDGALLSTGADGILRRWDAVACELLAAIPAHRAPAFALCVYPDGSRFATGSNRGELKIWSYPALRPVAVLRDTQRWIQELAFDPRGHQLLMAGQALVTIWDDRPPADRSRGRQAALDARAVAEPVVAKLFHELGSAPEVEAALADMELAAPVAEQALALARTRAGTPAELLRRAWRVAIHPGTGALDSLWSYKMARALTGFGPTKARHQSLLGIASYRLDKLDVAKTALLHARRLYLQDNAPEPLPCALVRIMVLARTGNVAESRRELDALLASDPVLDEESQTLLQEARSTLEQAERQKSERQRGR